MFKDIHLKVQQVFTRSFTKYVSQQTIPEIRAGQNLSAIAPPV